MDEVLQEREKLFQMILNYYTDMAKEDERYNKTCAKLKKNKKEFMKGKTFFQVINM